MQSTGVSLVSTKRKRSKNVEKSRIGLLASGTWSRKYFVSTGSRE